MSIPRYAFQIRRAGREARLRLNALPMPDTLQFANNVSISGQIGVDVKWQATGPRVPRGKGTGVPPDDPNAMLGRFAEATCTGNGFGGTTGFNFHTGELTADGFYAELGHERNGVFL